jgi:hypothetical protein
VHDDDADLVRRLRSGDEAAFAQLVRLQQAGFTRFRRAADTPLNLVLEVRP